MPAKPHTAAQDSLLRLALGLLVTDPRADITAATRAFLRGLLEGTAAQGTPFSAETKALVREPLLAYIRDYQGDRWERVARQFDEEGQP